MADKKPDFGVPTKLDWSTEFREGEWKELAGYYMKGTGRPNLDGQGFLPMMQELRPDVLKRYRLVIDSGRMRRGDLPDAARSLSSLYDHALTGYAKGIGYDMRGSRERGARRSDVAHVLALAWLESGGNEGIHGVADAAAEYLHEWDPATDGPGPVWPSGWAPDPEAWSCGIDWSRASDAQEISAEDLGRIEAWHRRVEGAVPDFVPFLAKFNPLVLRTSRARWENAMSGSLPKQYVALLLVSTATQTDALLRALHLARTFGVAREHVVSMFTRARVAGRGLATQATIDLGRVGALLDAWDAR